MKMTRNKKTGRLPNLRFPEFRDAGEWEEDLFSTLFEFKSTNSFSRDKLNYHSGSVKNIHYGDIHKKFNALFDITKEIVPFINSSETLEKFKNQSYCKEGDIIFADASEDLEDVGKSIELIYLNNEKILSGLHTILARPKTIKIIQGFCGYLFKSKIIRKQIHKQAQGTKVYGISAGRIGKIIILFPQNKNEQKKIADCLSSLDELITAEVKKLDRLKAHKKALMQNLFPAEGETMPKLRFPEFRDAGEWEEKKLGEIGTIISGLSGKSRDDFGTGDFFITYKQIFENSVSEIDKCGKVQIKNNEKQNELKLGDILFTATSETANEAGYASVILRNPSSRLFLNSFSFALRPNSFKNLSLGFSYYLFHSPIYRKRVNSIVQGYIRFNLSKLTFQKIILPIPTTKEQTRIADCLSSLDELITAETEKIELLKKHKKGMMQQLFPAAEELIYE